MHLVVSHVCQEFTDEEQDAKQIVADVQKRLSQIFPMSDFGTLSEQFYKDASDQTQFVNKIHQYYLAKKNQYSPEIFEEHVTKRMLLGHLDRKWMDQLHNMDILREGIGLRAYGQRDPLVEYKREGYDMFSALVQEMYEEALNMIFRVELVPHDVKEAQEQEVADAFPEHNMGSEEAEIVSNDGVKDNEKPKKENAKIGRNDPCHCGSGRKYKKCCMT